MSTHPLPRPVCTAHLSCRLIDATPAQAYTTPNAEGTGFYVMIGNETIGTVAQDPHRSTPARPVFHAFMGGNAVPLSATGEASLDAAVRELADRALSAAFHSRMAMH